MEYWTSNLGRIEPQICWVLNLKFVEYWTSNLRRIEPQICGRLNRNLLSIEPQISGVLNLKFVEFWTLSLWRIEPQICGGLNLKNLWRRENFYLWDESIQLISSSGPICCCFSYFYHIGGTRITGYIPRRNPKQFEQVKPVLWIRPVDTPERFYTFLLALI